MNALRFGYVCWALLGVIVSGCGKKPAAEELSQASAPEMAVGEVSVAPGRDPVPTAAVDPTAAADINVLSAKLREYVKTYQVIPSDLSELVRVGLISRLPDPPPGKQFGIQLHPLGYSVVLRD